MNANNKITMKEAIAQLTKKTGMIYRYSLCGIIVITLFSLFFLKQLQPFVGKETAIFLQSFAILAMIIVIPLSLKLYKRKIDSFLPINKIEQLEKVKKTYLLKLSANIGAALFCIAVYIITKDTSMLYCCVISFLVLIFFCKPDNIETDETYNIQQ